LTYLADSFFDLLLHSESPHIKRAEAHQLLDSRIHVFGTRLVEVRDDACRDTLSVLGPEGTVLLLAQDIVLHTQSQLKRWENFNESR
jgi:hypothetical protein